MTPQTQQNLRTMLAPLIGGPVAEMLVGKLAQMPTISERIGVELVEAVENKPERMNGFPLSSNPEINDLQREILSKHP